MNQTNALNADLVEFGIISFTVDSILQSLSMQRNTGKEHKTQRTFLKHLKDKKSFSFVTHANTSRERLFFGK